jgi:hypothetical protein
MWRIRTFNLREPRETLAERDFGADETAARAEFDRLAAHARAHGGGFELQHNHRNIARVSAFARNE